MLLSANTPGGIAFRDTEARFDWNETEERRQTVEIRRPMGSRYADGDIRKTNTTHTRKEGDSSGAGNASLSIGRRRWEGGLNGILIRSW